MPGSAARTTLAGELLKVMTGINIIHVPYKGNTPSITDAISGNVEMVFSGVPALVPHIKSGRLRGIAISSLERFAAVPDIPTFDESGVKGYEASNWFGLMAPIKTPREIITKVNADTNKVLAMPEVKNRFESEGVVPKGGSTEYFDKFIRSEIVKYELGHQKSQYRTPVIGSFTKEHPVKTLTFLLIVAAMALALPAQAQKTWSPSRNVEIVVGSAPGGSNDKTARAVEKAIVESKLIPTSLSVVNKPGGGSTIAFAYVRQTQG